MSPLASTGASGEVGVAPTAVPLPTEPPPPELPPTPGPSTAADATVGATRLVATRPPRPSPAAAAEPFEPTAAPREAPTPVLAASAAEHGSGAGAAAGPADNVYRSRRFARLSSSPEQARVYLDGHYAGIVDDWDDHGGGRTLPFATEGRHRLRLELPGYRNLNLDVLVSPDADDDTVEIDDELKRQSKVDYPKLKSPFDRTEGPVVFAVSPPDATVSEAGRTLGPVSSFGPSSPLKLSGPTVHDLVISAAGYESRAIRILVSSNADREKATVKLDLKALK